MNFHSSQRVFARLGDVERLHETLARLEQSFGKKLDELLAREADERASYSIREFCRRHGLSRSAYYRMKVKPRTFEAGGSTRISRSAERDWVREREAEAANNANATNYME